MSIKGHLSVLIKLATADGSFDGEEKAHIYMIGKANGITEAEIDNLVEHPEPLENIEAMSEDQKFDILFNIVQLMKIDSKVFLSEIKYCEEMAEKLGFKRKVISKLSSRVYSDPSITGNIESLKAMVQKFKA
jgi:uncharacterized membrane protein YebE (DUF533 family)